MKFHFQQQFIRSRSGHRKTNNQLCFSLSCRQTAKKFKYVPKPKQRSQVKQPTPNWLDLPSDVIANIIQRISVLDILENAQNVCSTWRKICKDPVMWRVIHIDCFSDPNVIPSWRWDEVCKHAVDRSQGQLVDITMVGFCDDELLEYIADRSYQLRRLEIALSYGDVYESWTEALKKFSLLEELSLYKTNVSKKAIETAGSYCPLLKILKLNKKPDALDGADDELAIAIGKNLPELRHLELIGDGMSNIGLQAILDGCRHLEFLDLRNCLYIDLKGDIGKSRYQQIKSRKLSNDSFDEGYLFIHKKDCEACDVISESGLFSSDFDDEYHKYFDYDDYRRL